MCGVALTLALKNAKSSHPSCTRICTHTDARCVDVCTADEQSLAHPHTNTHASIHASIHSFIHPTRTHLDNVSKGGVAADEVDVVLRHVGEHVLEGFLRQTHAPPVGL
eukprot:GHVU01055078.1.p2 GENE.GHVU01055078.1~~GHVU01055078.1.p2  ORF type:complete len:108 (-),score=4.02 GHVU01055078.1:130-453(-)